MGSLSWPAGGVVAKQLNGMGGTSDPSAASNEGERANRLAEEELQAVGREGILWMAFNNGGQSWDYCRHLVGYRPALPGSKDWAAEDAWIGPFPAPGRKLIHGMRPHGQKHILLSTHNHVMRLGSDDLVGAARKAGKVRSTAQWRKEFQERYSKGEWQVAVPLMIASRQFDQAKELLDRRADELGITGAGGREGLRLLL